MILPRLVPLILPRLVPLILLRLVLIASGKPSHTKSCLAESEAYCMNTDANHTLSIIFVVQIFLILILTKECGSGSGLKQLCLQDLVKDLDTLLDKLGLGASRKGPHEDLGPQ